MSFSNSTLENLLNGKKLSLKQHKGTSNVWKRFGDIYDSESKKLLNPKFYGCYTCSKVYSGHSSTFTLKNHKCCESKSQLELDQFFSNKDHKILVSKEDKNSLLNSIIRGLCLDMRPISFLNSPGTQSIISECMRFAIKYREGTEVQGHFW